MLYDIVQRQALFLSLLDNFSLLAWIFAAVIPFVIFLGRGRPGPEGRDVERHAAVAWFRRGMGPVILIAGEEGVNGVVI